MVIFYLMPLPKRRHSSTRRDKRRTHDKLQEINLSLCPVTGVYHEPHKAYWSDNKLYYRGKVIIDKTLLSNDSN